MKNGASYKKNKRNEQYLVPVSGSDRVSSTTIWVFRYVFTSVHCSKFYICSPRSKHSGGYCVISTCPHGNRSFDVYVCRKAFFCIGLRSRRYNIQVYMIDIWSEFLCIVEQCCIFSAECSLQNVHLLTSFPELLPQIKKSPNLFRVINRS